MDSQPPSRDTQATPSSQASSDPSAETGEDLNLVDDTVDSHVKVWNSAQILGGCREAIILHGDQTYRLLCTRNGKLILQK